VSRSSEITSLDNDKYWGPLMLYFESIIESVCEVYAPFQVNGMTQEALMERLAKRHLQRRDDELAASGRVKAKNLESHKLDDPDRYKTWTALQLKDELVERLKG
jgi:hypothetical protein